MSPEDVARAIDLGVAAAGLRASQRGVVERWLHEPPERWRSCCGSSCDPCVLTIGVAIDRARRELGLPALEP